MKNVGKFTQLSSKAGDVPFYTRLTGLFHGWSPANRSSLNFYLLKHGCCVVLSIHTWFLPLWFLLVLENEIAAMRA